MNDGTLLVCMARKRLWVASAQISERGEVTFDVDGLDLMLDGNCRLLAKRVVPSGMPFALGSSPEEASAACDTLLSAMKEYAQTNEQRRPRTTEKKVARLMRRANRRSE